MKKVNLLIITSLLIVLSACGMNKENEMKGEVDIHGYVLDKTNDSIFVVSKDATDLSANDGISDYYDAINLSDAPKEVRIGDEVKVWYSGSSVQESYPMGGTVGHLEIMPETKPESANLSQREAIEKALENQQNVIIRSISYNQEAGLWTVEFKGLHDDETWIVKVNDTDSVTVDSDISGYIMAKEADRILIVNPHSMDFSDTGGVSAYYDASWAMTTEKNIHVADKVNVWFDGGVNDSYPTQATVQKVEVLPPVIHEGARLTESEALGNALTNANPENNVLVVKSIEFDQENKQWKIECFGTFDEKTYEFQVEDK